MRRILSSLCKYNHIDNRIMLPASQKLTSKNYSCTSDNYYLNLFLYYWSRMNTPIKEFKYLTLENGHLVRTLFRKCLVWNISQEIQIRNNWLKIVSSSSVLLNKKEKFVKYKCRIMCRNCEKQKNNYNNNKDIKSPPHWHFSS